MHALWSNASNVHSLTPPPPWSACARTVEQCQQRALINPPATLECLCTHWTNAINVRMQSLRIGAMPSMCECSHSALEQCHQCARAVTPHWSNAINVRMQSLRTGAMPPMCACSHSALEQSNATNVRVQSLRTGAMPPMCACSHSALEQSNAINVRVQSLALEQCHQCERAVSAVTEPPELSFGSLQRPQTQEH